MHMVVSILITKFINFTNTKGELYFTKFTCYNIIQYSMYHHNRNNYYAFTWAIRIYFEAKLMCCIKNLYTCISAQFISWCPGQKPMHSTSGQLSAHALPFMESMQQPPYKINIDVNASQRCQLCLSGHGSQLAYPGDYGI